MYSFSFDAPVGLDAARLPHQDVSSGQWIWRIYVDSAAFKAVIHDRQVRVKIGNDQGLGTNDGVSRAPEGITRRGAVIRPLLPAAELPSVVCSNLPAMVNRRFKSQPLRIVGPLALCALIAGCNTRDDLVVWKAQSRSPDGLWLAKADTVQNGGFGTAEIHTTVFLERENTKSPPQEVFVVECNGPIPHPYTLDNKANEGGCVGLTITWRTPKNLLLTYRARSGNDVVLQVAKYGGVDIAVEPVSDDKGIENPSPHS